MSTSATALIAQASARALSSAREWFRRLGASFVTLGLTLIALVSPSYAQAPPLGTTADYAILAGAGITNTGPTVITGIPAHPGDIGSSTGAITGFPPGIVTPPGIIHPIGDGPTIAAQISLTTAYNNLAGRSTTVDLTGQNLGGMTLVPGVYNFASSAQLTGALTLNGLGNSNAIFVFNIGSTLTTASASAIALINGAQGGNVFWRVGSSATLGTTTSFAGDILAQASITLNTGATITCGAAWAQTGAVTLDSNTISICALLSAGGGGAIIGPSGLPLFVSLLPSSATTNQIAVANGLDSAVNNGAVLPLAFANLFNLSPADLGNALTQLSGEAGAGVAEGGIQTMNSFLSLVTNPFTNRAPARPVPQHPMLIYKAPAYYKASGQVAADPPSWNVWGAAYGGQSNIAGDAFIGSHDQSVRTYGLATGFDYTVTPYTVVGFALAGGGTNYGLSSSLGGGRSDMLQAAVYSVTRIDAAYVSAAVAYAWHDVSTDRFLTVAGTDHLTANFSANNVGGRIEGGYRFAIPSLFEWWWGFGVTPYGALQAQAFHTPSYSETAASGASIFALDYSAHTTTAFRTELGAWLDRSLALDSNAILTLRTRTAWAHDQISEPSITAAFQQLQGSSFTVFGAKPAVDLFLTSANAEVDFRNGFAVALQFDGEFGDRLQRYAGNGRVRYRW